MRIFHYNDEETELHRYLAQRGHQNTIVGAESDPFAIIRGAGFDAAFVGLHPHGLALLQALHQKNPSCFVTIITSDHNTRTAVEAMKHGAFDYLLTPLDFTEVERFCILMAREQQMQKERRNLEDRLAEATGTTRMVGSSEPMRALHKLVAKAAASSAPVMISGETGTGKELIARLLHELSPRRENPFVGINCNAIPTTLLESELFGYRKGAFTGADRDRDGLLSRAHGGTFFLDEISDLEVSIQGKILRAVEEGEVLPVGGEAAKHLDVRFIAATNHHLEVLVEARKFREDLYYRLNVLPIHVPPLRDRMEDLAHLTRHFLELYCCSEGREPLKVAPAVWRWMGTYHWPGNVRELENLCQRAVALTDGDTFDTDVLALTGSFAGTPGPALPPGRDEPPHGYRAARREMDRQLLQQALQDHGQNISQAARALGISRTTFYNKVRKLGLELPRQRGSVWER